ncbi:MAG: AAA family ATPase [Dehalococcoidia bacterium]|nr:AAA family ATPase [Dehalococcoidia bacterium]
MATEVKFQCSTFLNKLDNKPRYWGGAWATMAERLMTHKERAEKDGPLWSPALYKGTATRGNSGVEALTAAVGDLDGGCTYDDIEAPLADYEHVVHSTFSHTADKAKFRVVIPFVKPVPAGDWPDLKARIDEHVFKGLNDPGTCDQSRIYYSPSCLPGAPRFTKYHEGALLDPYTLPPATAYIPPNGGGEHAGPATEAKMQLGKTALDFVANGAPLGEQRRRALAAARNYLSAGYSVEDTAAALWRGLQASVQDPDRGPWTYDDALFMAQNLDSSEAPPLDVIAGPVAPRAEMRKEGLGYRFDYPTAGVSIVINHIRRSSSEFKGEIRITANIPSIPHKIHWASLNLSSTSARSTLARHLTKRADVMDWDDVLEDICDKVATLEREGQPFMELCDLPQEAHSPWLIENFIPRGETTTIFGEGGSGKSMLALALAISVHVNVQMVPGFSPVQQGNVLYLDWETNNLRITRRARTLARAVDEMALPNIGYRRCTLPMAEQLEEVLKRCQEKNIILVIVDSVEMAMAGTRENGGDANDAILRLHTALRALNVSVLLVDHVSKNGAKEGGKRNPYGGIFKTNLARMEYELRKADNSESGMLRMGLFNTKRNDDGVLFPPVALALKFELGMAQYVTEERPIQTPADDAKHALRIADRLRYSDLTIKQLADQLGIAEKTIGTTLGRMAEARQVEKVAKIGKADLWGIKRTPTN